MIRRVAGLHVKSVLQAPNRRRKGTIRELHARDGSAIQVMSGASLTRPARNDLVAPATTIMLLSRSPLVWAAWHDTEGGT